MSTKMLAAEATARGFRQADLVATLGFVLNLQALPSTVRTGRVKEDAGIQRVVSINHMVTLYPGRYTTSIEGPFVVFLIGVRINRLLFVRKWLPVAKAMGPMLKELYANPSLGLLAAHTSLYWRGVMVTQYWRSFEHLVAYAQSRDAVHLPAWKAFNQSVGSDGTVGIWHETYQVADRNYECIYANMPRFGLSAAGTHEPATGARHDARSRMQSRPPDL